MKFLKFILIIFFIAVLSLSGYSIYTKKAPWCSIIICTIDPRTTDEIIIQPADKTKRIVLPSGLNITIANDRLLVTLIRDYSSDDLDVLMDFLPGIGTSVVGQIPGQRLLQFRVKDPTALESTMATIQEMPMVEEIEFSEVNTQLFKKKRSWRLFNKKDDICFPGSTNLLCD